MNDPKPEVIDRRPAYVDLCIAPGEANPDPERLGKADLDRLKAALERIKQRSE